jgi:hypothetical protein
MKRVVEAVEGPRGLESLLNKSVLLLCQNYFYTGKLTGINTDSVELSDASLVYDTGNWHEKGYADAQKLPGKIWYVQLVAIEAFGESK